MLRAGLGEVTREAVVRRGVLLSAVLIAFLAFDEYFGLLARDGGTATASVPLLVAITVSGQVVGTALAGRTASMRAVTMGRAVAVAAILLGGERCSAVSPDSSRSASATASSATR